MSYKAQLNFPDGETLEDEWVFETEKEAEDYGLQMSSEWQHGAEVLHLSNPGDNPLPEEDEHPEIDVIEVDDPPTPP